MDNFILRVDLSLMFLGCKFQLDEVSGTVVVDVVAGVDRGRPRLVVVDGDVGGGWWKRGARRGGARQGREQRRVYGRRRMLTICHLEDHLHVV